jgi:hypothetical protein
MGNKEKAEVEREQKVKCWGKGHSVGGISTVLISSFSSPPFPPVLTSRAGPRYPQLPASCVFMYVYFIFSRREREGNMDCGDKAHSYRTCKMNSYKYKIQQ